MKEIINEDWLDSLGTNYILTSFELVRNCKPSMYGYKRRTKEITNAIMNLEALVDYTYWFRDCVMTFDKKTLNMLTCRDSKRVIELNRKAGWIELLEEDDQTYTIKLNKEKIENDLHVPGYFKSLYDERDRIGNEVKWG